MPRNIGRLARMDRAELLWRGRAAARTACDRVRLAILPPQWHRRALSNVLCSGRELKETRRAARRGHWRDVHAALVRHLFEEPSAFVVDPTNRQSLVDRIRTDGADGVDHITRRADRLLAGDYDLLGYSGLRFSSHQPTAAGDIPDWHLDPIHQRVAPLRFWASVPFLDPSCGDHKIIWELNRQQHWVVLGQAFWLTGNKRYRARALAELSSWLQANPPLVGINWASMLELALRSLSWIWALYMFAEPDALEDSWFVDLLVAIDRQLDQIEKNLSYYFSPNTHLLGEALALYVAGHALPWLKASRRRIAIGRRVLKTEIGRQISSDGGHCERSAHYHRYTLDFYVLALITARINSDPAAAVFERAVERLASAARVLADDTGRLPHFGDDDGGALLPSRHPVDNIRDSLWTASFLLDRPDLAVGPGSEETIWLLSHPALLRRTRPSRGVAAVAPIASVALSETGYYVSRSAAGDHLVMDAGRHGYQNGGHAHADALSLTCTVRGTPYLIDPGTGCYTIDRVRRDHLRSTPMHNTVTVDDRSSSIAAGPFHWSHTATARTHRWRANTSFDYVDASHDGYRPLEHRRRVLTLHGDLLVVADVVIGAGVHRAAVHWHIHPDWQVEVCGRRVSCAGPARHAALVVPQGAIERFAADPGTGLGWHAPVYGRFERCTTIRVSHTSSLPLWLVSIFDLSEDNSIESVDLLPVWALADDLQHSAAVRITRASSIDHFVIAEPVPHSAFGVGLSGASRFSACAAGAISSRVAPGGSHVPFSMPSASWHAGAVDTDAAMLFWRAKPDGSVSRIALVDGSWVRMSGDSPVQLELSQRASDFDLRLGRTIRASSIEAHASVAARGARVRVDGREVVTYRNHRPS